MAVKEAGNQSYSLKRVTAPRTARASLMSVPPTSMPQTIWRSSPATASLQTSSTRPVGAVAGAGRTAAPCCTTRQRNLPAAAPPGTAWFIRSATLMARP